MPTIKLLNRAEAELKESCIYYEKQQKGLSKFFRKELSSIIEQIGLNPFLYNSRYNTDLHFAALKKFPFIVIYWFDQKLNTVFITSIFHTKRNPEF
ncbi:MAG: type II toxin-antitoxin system RelE/ParE family toxin [Sphingobacteriaceae bacterium]|nr:MAG: type II toxin-antitoxin system RelE/ParE family toxin [Sphingobacteriaceae bacterium]